MRGLPSVVIVITGMGSEAARRAMQQALKGPQPGWIVSAGFAGGLDPDLEVGDVGYSADAGFPRMDALKQCSARPARFLEVDRVLVTVEQKRECRQRTRADAVDMESETIRDMARSRGIPSATVRAISDSAHEALPLDFNAFMLPDGRFGFGRLFGTLLRRPGKIVDLIRFSSKTRLAAGRLAACLAVVCGSDD